MARRRRGSEPEKNPYEGEDTVEVQVRMSPVFRVKCAPYYDGGGSFSWWGGVIPPGGVAEIPLSLAQANAGRFVKPGSQERLQPLTERVTQLIEDVHTDELLAIEDQKARAQEKADEVRKQAEARVEMIRQEQERNPNAKKTASQQADEDIAAEDTHSGDDLGLGDDPVGEEATETDDGFLEGSE